MNSDYETYRRRTARKMGKVLKSFSNFVPNIRKWMAYIEQYHAEHGYFPMDAVDGEYGVKMQDICGKPVASFSKIFKYGHPCVIGDNARGLMITVYSHGIVEFTECREGDAADERIDVVPLSKLSDSRTAGYFVDACGLRGVNAERAIFAASALHLDLVQDMARFADNLERRVAA